MTKYKLIVFVPLTHADLVRKALGDACVGQIGNYDYCSFSSIGFGRYRGNENSNPAIGKPLQHEKVEEERIEVLVLENDIQKAIQAMKSVHPYEEVAYDVYKLEDF